eukprot:EC095481.1.p2 GENE.EC095481.1~~EC095481.1.p2  ORF type:complete len:151 (+),score=5.14 EC095481.1:61-513(+)
MYLFMIFTRYAYFIIKKPQQFRHVYLNQQFIFGQKKNPSRYNGFRLDGFIIFFIPTFFFRMKHTYPGLCTKPYSGNNQLLGLFSIICICYLYIINQNNYFYSIYNHICQQLISQLFKYIQLVFHSQQYKILKFPCFNNLKFFKLFNSVLP